ncbi:MAG: hypothetical protein QXX55_00055 [Candidatus Pacearchaeota archaeon]
MDKQGKERGFRGVFLVMFLSLLIVSFWDKFPLIKNIAHSILDPTIGFLLKLNLIWGMIIVVFIMSLIMTLAQKYGTDQGTLRELKKEQKRLNEESKKFRDDPQKMMEFNKKIIPMSMQMFKLSMRPLIYTAIPLILFFRWFTDFFNNEGNPLFFGFLSWFWFYLIASIIFSSIFRKIMDVV